MTRPESDRRLALGVSEISFAIGDIALLMNSPDDEHRTMKLSSLLGAIDKATEKMRAAMDRSPTPEPAKVAEAAANQV